MLSNNSKKEILLYGGAFDPFHNGHFNTIKYCLKNLKINEIWLVLTFENVDGKKISWWEYRYEMLKIALSNELNEEELEKVKIELYEIGKGKSYTLDTLKALIKQHPDYDFSFLLGDDVFLGLENWINYKQFINLTKKIYILNRGKTEELSYNKLFNNLDYINKFEVLKNPIWTISSTEIRLAQNLKEMNPKVLEYCNELGLYFFERIKSYLSNYRVRHTFNVAVLAVELAKIHDLSVNECYCAAILHDIAKELPVETLNWYLKQYDEAHLNIPHAIKHQYVAKIIAKNKFLVKNENVLEAIANHTCPENSNKPIVKKITKLIYLSDKLSEDRAFEGIEQFRDLMKKNLDEAFTKLYEKIQLECENYSDDRKVLRT